MRTLTDPADRAALLERVGRLTAESTPLWGRMTVGGMLCHLTDAFRSCMGELPVRDYSSFRMRTLYRWIALTLPLPFPKGVPTAAEFDQDREGTRPEEFEADRDRLVETATRFVDALDPDQWRHPAFGPLTRGEWGRWGWRHMDHHLRQFGV